MTTTGLGCVGDGQMRALDTRADLVQHQDWYGSPWPLTGATGAAMDAWITAGVTTGEAGECARRWRPHDRGHEVLAAAGDELERTCGAPGGAGEWSARVVVVRSPRHANQQAAGLATRLRHAETPLTALTPPRGRGTRQSTDAALRVEASDRGLTAPRVDGWLRVAWEQPVEPTTRDVGRGRGALHRATRVIQHTRDPSTHITRQEDISAARHQRVGWKAFATHAGHPRLSWQDAVVCSRHAYRVERLFNRLKSRVHLAPLCVKLHEPIEGLTYLLTLGVRV